MVRKCCVPSCARRVTRDAGTFHRFPNDEYLREKWLRALKISSVNNSSRICSYHFAADDYIIDITGYERSKAKSLKPGAVPSILDSNPVFNDYELLKEYVQSNSEDQPKYISFCIICKCGLSQRDAKYDLHIINSKTTKTNLLDFIKRKIDVDLIATEMFCCKSCLKLLNELDYFENKCDIVRNKLLGLINSEMVGDLLSNPEVTLNEISSIYDDDDHQLEDDHSDNDVKEEDMHYTDENVRIKKEQNEETQCSDCNEIFKSPKALKKHMKNHNPETWVCDICGMTLRYKSSLEQHKGTHTATKPFECPQCKKQFRQKGCLQRHMRIHTGETRYQCEQCGKKFVHHTSLSAHLLYHSGEKKFKCSLCDTYLISNSHLKRHLRTHSGEKEHECKVCGKKFLERYNLYTHEKIHQNNGGNTTIITDKDKGLIKEALEHIQRGLASSEPDLELQRDMLPTKIELEPSLLSPSQRVELQRDLLPSPKLELSDD